MSSSAGHARRSTGGASTSGGLDSRLADIGTQLQSALPFYASLCGRTLARAHARAGDPALVSGYVGKSKAFEEAISAFAVAYADQTETDWQSFEAAIKAGRIVQLSRKQRSADPPLGLGGPAGWSTCRLTLTQLSLSAA